MSIFKDTRTLAAKTVEMVDAIMKGGEAPINDRETYDNGTGIIPGLLGQNWCIWNTGLYELLPAFILALIVAVVVSLMTEEPSEEMQKEFDEATEGNFW